MASSHSVGFSIPHLEKRLRELNTTLQSIQGVSQWLIHHRKHAKTIVSVWYKEVQKADAGRKLNLLYLANDVIQNSKRKGTEFKLEFTRALPRTFQLVNKENNESLTKSVQRILSVWEDRHVFEAESISKFKTIIASGSLHPHRRTRSESDVKSRIAVAPPPEPKRVKLDTPPPEDPPNDRQPPEAEDLLKRMLAIDGPKSVAQDTATRQKIACFPPEIHDPELFSEIKDKVAVERLFERVEEASKVMTEYNKRLEEELKERQEIQELLDVFIWQQKGLLREAKKKLKDHQGKLERVTVVREELKSHLANLPDFSKLPMGSVNSLAPLPSVGDLFN